jgi:hypothetical protein
MDSSPEHNSSQAEPTIEKIKKWNEEKLLKKIQKMRPGLLRGNNLEKFNAAFIDGDVFVDRAGDVGFFKNECNLPIGISMRLAKLASELGKEQDTSTGKSTDHAPLLFSLH